MDNEKAIALLSQIAKNDKAAFEQLYKGFSRRVYAYALNQVNDPARAEEIVSDTLFDVWQQAGRFRGDSKVSTWLIGIARNKVLMAYRGRRADEVHEELDDVAQALEADTPDGFTHVALSERRQGVADCMKRLSRPHREVLHLVYFEDAALGDIQKLLGVPYGTVQTRVHHAKLNIRSCLAQLLFAEGRSEQGRPT